MRFNLLSFNFLSRLTGLMSTSAGSDPVSAGFVASEAAPDGANDTVGSDEPTTDGRVGAGRIGTATGAPGDRFEEASSREVQVDDSSIGLEMMGLAVEPGFIGGRAGAEEEDEELVSS
uniref:Putative secreted protein n=1 Tax=Anopheles darlingi TaxID=43151 RepID=A0A2M4D3B0_ANODA